MSADKLRLTGEEEEEEDSFTGKHEKGLIMNVRIETSAVSCVTSVTRRTGGEEDATHR